jgi:hypothetical protein
MDKPQRYGFLAPQCQSNSFDSIRTWWADFGARNHHIADQQSFDPDRALNRRSYAGETRATLPEKVQSWAEIGYRVDSALCRQEFTLQSSKPAYILGRKVNSATNTNGSVNRSILE